MYEDFHYKVKTVVRPSYLYDGNPDIGKLVLLYADDTQSYVRRKETYRNHYFSFDK